MSLVNDMLRDLDERKRGDSSGYRPVATPAAKKGRWLWITLVVLMIGAALYFVATELSSKVDERSQLISWFNQEPQKTETVSISPVEEREQPVNANTADKVDASSVDQLSVATAKNATHPSTPTVANISLINWTMQSPEQGYFTFWIDQVKPFVLYGKTDSSLDIAIENSQFLADLPHIDASIMSAIEIITEKGKSRFKLIASGPAAFKPRLKNNPARLIVTVKILDAEPSTIIDENIIAKVEEPTMEESPSEQPQVAHAAIIKPEKEPPAEPSSTQQLQAGQWKKSLNTLPTDSSTVRSARRLLSQQRSSEAESLLKDYIVQAPSSLQSQYLLVQLYLATERYSAADILLAQAPSNLSWSLLKARLLLQQGQATDAVRLLEKYPGGQSREDYLDLLASGYQQTGQHGAAVARYLSLLGLNPQEARWWVNLGVSLEHLGQHSKALDAYQSALQVPNVDQSLKQYARQQSQRLMQLQ